MQIKPQRYRLSVVLKSLFYPLTSPDVIDSFKSREFDVAPFPSSPLQAGSRTYVSGSIAQKHGCSVLIDSNRKIITAEGKSVENVVKTLSELLAIMSEDFLVDLGKEIDFVELIADMVIESDANPIKVIQNAFANLEIYGKFSKILENETSSSRISIVPKGPHPLSRKWFEIRIEPRWTMPNKSYYVNIVFREIDPSKVIAFAGEVNSKISDLIEKIEKP